MLFDLELNDVFTYNKKYEQTGVIYSIRKTKYNFIQELDLFYAIIDINHEKFNRYLMNETLSTDQIGFYPGGTKGIYYGYKLEDFVDTYFDTDPYGNYSKCGQYFSDNEVSEIYGYKNCDDMSDEERFNRTHLKSGREFPKSKNFKNSYGVADNVPQILKHFRNAILNPDLKIVIQISIVSKKDNPSWRWHKNGEYIGNFKHKCEHLGDEVGIDHVLTYKVIKIGEPKHAVSSL